MLGRLPLMPSFIGSNTDPTLPLYFGNRAEATAGSISSKGNLWMWRYGLRQPCKVTMALHRCVLGV
jgi:hypothetical protein